MPLSILIIPERFCGKPNCSCKSRPLVIPSHSTNLLTTSRLGPSALAITLFKLFVRMSLNITPTTQRKFSKTWVPGSIFILAFNFAYKIAMISQFASGGGIIGAFATPTSTTPINPHQLDIGVKMAKFGLLVQAICIGLFLIVSLHWTFVARRWSSTGITDEPTKLGWKKLAFAINVSATLIMVRTVYRILEFSPTSHLAISKFLSTHEFTFWVCEALPMLVVLVLLAIYHPGYCLPRTFTVFWLRERKVKKLERKILESQTLPQHSEPQTHPNGMFTGAGAGMAMPQIPVYAYVPKQ